MHADLPKDDVLRSAACSRRLKRAAYLGRVVSEADIAKEWCLPFQSVVRSLSRRELCIPLDLCVPLCGFPFLILRRATTQGVLDEVAVHM